jgi:hypothetical protein
MDELRNARLERRAAQLELDRETLLKREDR